MTQLALWSTTGTEPEKPINVASIPQRSPFRYPGGKTWLVPHIRTWLRSRAEKPSLFVEPFLGGGIVSLTVAFEELADKVLGIEFDEEVAAVWKTLAEGDIELLAQRIVDFDLSLANVRKELEQPPIDIAAQAFQTILRNRTLHGGILAPGSGFIKHGEAGKGIASRWYPSTLKRRILAIKTIRDRFRFLQGDGLRTMMVHASSCSTVFFIDPPYTVAGKKAGRRLYKHSELDHEDLFRIAASLCGDFLMTYDDCKGVRDLAAKNHFETRLVAMKNTHHAEMSELLVGRDLSWVPQL